MGKTFRKNFGHNKFNKRDIDAKNKFSKKFRDLKKHKNPKSIEDGTDIGYIINREYDNN